jgi:hypothetical protein
METQTKQEYYFQVTHAFTINKMANKRPIMSLLIDKFKAKFELYRFCLPKHHREIFDKIIVKSDEQTLATTPGGYDAAVFNQLIDMEERLRLLEK